MQTKPDRATSRDAKERRTQRRDAARDRAIAHSSQGDKLWLTMSDDPSTINDYGHGGERTRDLAVSLTASVPDAVFLYQRRLDRRRAVRAGDPAARVEPTERLDPIDLIAVAHTGIWIVDIQTCSGGRVEATGRKWRWSSRYTHLMIRGRDRTAYLDRLTRQAQALSETLADLGRSDIPVHRAFCFFDADTGWRGTPRVGNTLLTTPKRLRALLRRRSRLLSDIEVSAVAQAIGQRLPRQYVRD